MASLFREQMTISDVPAFTLELMCDGGLRTVVTLSEPVYSRLSVLQSVIANVLESSCSLSYRT